MARKKASRKAAGNAAPRKKATKATRTSVSRSAGLGPEQSIGSSVDKLTGAVESLKAVQVSPGVDQSKLNAAITSLEDASAVLAALCRRARKVLGS
jgi:hypothetical protein